MDSLYKATGLSFIVVGVDHGNEKRINEYNPYDSTKYGKGVGEIYLRDLAEVLKPAIDKAFRTSTLPKHTWIAGSSMGGLISAYGVFIYPKTFGGAGVFSPAFWINHSVENKAVQYSQIKKRKHHFFFYAGGKESAEMVGDMEKIATIVCNKQTVRCETIMDAEAKHNESAWTIHFHEFLKFMSSNGALR
jgi:predicted alpha/beta superfamily hydrolase